jgi:hypothetical protein
MIFDKPIKEYISVEWDECCKEIEVSVKLIDVSQISSNKLLHE